MGVMSYMQSNQCIVKSYLNQIQYQSDESSGSLSLLLVVLSHAVFLSGLYWVSSLY